MGPTDIAMVYGIGTLMGDIQIYSTKDSLNVGYDKSFENMLLGH